MRRVMKSNAMKSTILLASIAATTAFGAAACSGTASSAPTSADYDNVAQSTAALVIQAGGGGEVGSMVESANLAVGVMPAGVTANGSGSFGDVHAGLDYEVTISCTDAAGAPLSACGPEANAAQASVSWSGDLSLPPDFTANVSRQGNWTLSGLQTGTVTFDGTSSFDLGAQFTSVFHGAQASVDLRYSASYDAVAYSISAHHATAGTIRYSITGSREASTANGQRDASFTMDANVAFSTDGSATITLDGSHRYQVLGGGIVIKL
jgi:hypothetical protein